MASCQCLPFFLLLSLLFLLAFPSINGAQEADLPGQVFPVSPGNVVMTLYYESVCPEVKNFILGPLTQATRSDLMSILDLKLVPWGNTILRPDNVAICQHGIAECYLNAIQACAIDIWPDVKTHFSFIGCIETKVPNVPSQEAQVSTPPPQDIWKKCADQLNLPQQPIQDCFSSGQGSQLLLKNSKITLSLSPQMAFVPWVTVNGVPLGKDYMNFVKYVCNQSKSTPKPQACASLTDNSSGRAKSSGQSALHGKHVRQVVHGLTG